MSTTGISRNDPFYDDLFEAPSPMSTNADDELFAQPGFTGALELRQFLADAARQRQQQQPENDNDTRVPARRGFCSRLSRHSR